MSVLLLKNQLRFFLGKILSNYGIIVAALNINLDFGFIDATKIQIGISSSYQRFIFDETFSDRWFFKRFSPSSVSFLMLKTVIRLQWFFLTMVSFLLQDNIWQLSPNWSSFNDINVAANGIAWEIFRNDYL